MKPETRIRLQTDFYTFVRKVFRETHGTRLEICPYIKTLCWELRDITSGEPDWLAVSLPPRHLKTIICSICVPVWELAHRPKSKILIIAGGDHLTGDIGKKIVDLIKAPWFKDLFGSLLAKTTPSVTDFRTRQGGEVFIVGLGRKFTGRGSNLTIIDDLVELKDASDIKIHNEIETLYDSSIITRTNNRKRARMLMVNHRTNEQDLIGRLRKRKKTRWRFLAVPFVAPRKKVYLIGNDKWVRQKGELLLPEHYSKNDVEDILNKPLAAWLYQQGCDPKSKLRLRREHFPLVDLRSVPAASIIFSIDPGMRAGSSNSASVIAVFFVTTEGLYVLADLWREQCNFGTLSKAYRELHRAWRPGAVLIEGTALGPALLDSALRKGDFGLHEILPDNRSKKERLAAVTPIIRAKCVALNAHGAWVEDFLAEVLGFPDGRFDDQVDVLTQFLDWITKNTVELRPPRGTLGLAFGSGPYYGPPVGGPLSGPQSGGGSSSTTPSGGFRGVVVVRGRRLWR